MDDDKSKGMACLGVIALALVLVFMPLLVIFAGGVAGSVAAQAAANCGTTPGAAVPASTGGANKTAYVRTIIGVAKGRNVPQRGWIVALATALQESQIRVLANSKLPESLALPHDGVGSDGESVGIFQQQTRYGWGTVQQLMDAAASANAFFGGAPGETAPGLLSVTNWEQMSIAVAAEAVQGSTQGSLYAQWETEATALATANSDAPAIAATGPAFQTGGSAGGANSTTDGTPTILGASTLNADQLVAWWGKQHYAALALQGSPTIQELAADYINEGTAEGVRGDLAFAQAIEETGGFTNSDARTISNFAGIGHPDSAASGMAFASVLLGVRAQIQLLKSVVLGNTAALANPRVAPSWGGKQATTLAGLSANWASDPNYSAKIMTIFNSMLTSAGLPTWAAGGGCPTSTGAVNTAGYALPLDPQYMSPLGRTDGGVDIENAPVNGKVYSMTDGVVTAVAANGPLGVGWGFGPNYPVIRATNGALTGKFVYYGHVGVSLVKVGDTVKAGQEIATLTHIDGVGPSSQGHIEVGFSDASGNPVCHGGADPATTCGAEMRTFLISLDATFKITAT